MNDKAQIAQALLQTLISPNVCDSNLEDANVVDVLEEIASALRVLGYQSDQETAMGALEAHAWALKEGAAEIARALQDVAAAIREHA